MIELEGNRIWNPDSDEIFHSYDNINTTQKLQLWIRIYVEDTIYSGDYHRMRIEIPKGLYCTREFKEDNTGLYDEEYIMFKEKTSDETIIKTRICDITCICILDEE